MNPGASTHKKCCNLRYDVIMTKIVNFLNLSRNKREITHLKGLNMYTMNMTILVDIRKV